MTHYDAPLYRAPYMRAHTYSLYKKVRHARHVRHTGTPIQRDHGEVEAQSPSASPAAWLEVRLIGSGKKTYWGEINV
jgi:hypothetical protein